MRLMAPMFSNHRPITPTVVPQAQRSGMKLDIKIIPRIQLVLPNSPCTKDANVLTAIPAWFTEEELPEKIEKQIREMLTTMGIKLNALNFTTKKNPQTAYSLSIETHSGKSDYETNLLALRMLYQLLKERETLNPIQTAYWLTVNQNTSSEDLQALKKTRLRYNISNIFPEAPPSEEASAELQKRQASLAESIENYSFYSEEK